MNSPIQFIIDKVKMYTLDSLIRVAFDRVKKDELIHQPWTLLAYFEIVYREADNNYLKLIATETIFSSVCQHIFELMDKHPLANFKAYSPNKIFHVLAYQQFPYQNQYNQNDIQRQYFLFDADNINGRLNKRFEKNYRVSIKQYLYRFRFSMSYFPALVA